MVRREPDSLGTPKDPVCCHRTLKKGIKGEQSVLTRIGLNHILHLRPVSLPPRGKLDIDLTVIEFRIRIPGEKSCDDLGARTGEREFPR